MGSQGSKDWSKHRDEFIKYMNLTSCRVGLLEKKNRNELIIMYHNIEQDIKNGNDPNIKAEQSIYQEHNIEVLKILMKNINILTTRKHLLNIDTIDQIITYLHTFIYCINKLNLEESIPINKIIIDIYGKKYHQDIINNNNLVDKQLLVHLFPPIPDEEELKERVAMVTNMYKSNLEGVNKPSSDVKNVVHTGNRDYDEILNRVSRLRNNDSNV